MSGRYRSKMRLAALAKPPIPTEPNPDHATKSGENMVELASEPSSRRQRCKLPAQYVVGRRVRVGDHARADLAMDAGPTRRPLPQTEWRHRWLDDRCPHRWAPLSLGRVIDDNIQCPYHGITFAPNGECVKIPSQKTNVSGCAVHAYPVREEGPFVWV
jgi:hypothetical protein